MAESIFARVTRLLSGTVQDAADRLEQAGGLTVMREAIREVDRTLDQVRADHEAVMARRLQAARQQRMLRDRLNQLTEKAKFAIAEGREDLAEAALSRQIDFEKQSADLDRAQYEAREEETRLETCIASLQARKKEMEDSLSAFLASRAEAGMSSDASACAKRDAEKQVTRSEQAFERAMAGAGGVGFTRTDVKTVHQIAEIETMQKSAAIAARIAKLKAGAA